MVQGLQDPRRQAPEQVRPRRQVHEQGVHHGSHRGDRQVLPGPHVRQDREHQGTLPQVNAIAVD